MDSLQESPQVRHIHAPIHRKGAQRAIAALVARTGGGYIAHPPKYTDLILGWCCVEPQPYGAVVHYVYVKKAYRRANVASALVSHAFDLLGVDPDGDIRFSHWRLPGGYIAQFRGWRFDPYTLTAPVQKDPPKCQL